VSRTLAALAALVCAAAAAAATGATAGAQPEDGGRGQELYNRDCAYCHGPEGEGAARGPSLVDVGAASAYFWVATGRMPIEDATEQPRRRDPAYPPEEVDALVDYVATFGEGPDIPPVDAAAGDLQRGHELYQDHCAACHSGDGQGGVMAGPRHPPRMGPVEPVDTALALLLGPGPMPAFDEVFDQHEVDSVARYVEYLGAPERPGGFSLGPGGPVAEALIAFLVVLFILIPLVRWIGRSHE
jgi:ubiquinol-cytochrome c reductase cytochrome c subunit